jgi:hypothetical protein
MNTPRSTGPTGFSETDMLNYAVRMVIPLRREFGRSLDVPHFMHDFAYAREIIDQAKASQDARLREYARYFETKLLGPRDGSRPAKPATPAVANAPALTPPAPEPTPAPIAPELSEAELRAKMMNKYRSGLR